MSINIAQGPRRGPLAFKETQHEQEDPETGQRGQTCEATGQDLHCVRRRRTRQAAGGQDLLFGFGHLPGFAGDELDAAGGAARVPAAGVKLIDLRFILQRIDQALSLRDFELSDAIDTEFGHKSSPM